MRLTINFNDIVHIGTLYMFSAKVVVFMRNPIVY